MTTLALIGGVGAVAIIGSIAFILIQQYIHRNPYVDQGLRIEWDVGGATSSYPWIEVSAEYQGSVIKPDFHFGGIVDPRLRFRDYDGDGLKDIVFEDDNYMQVMAYYPPTDTSPPRFKVLRNDITWP